MATVRTSGKRFDRRTLQSIPAPSTPAKPSNKRRRSERGILHPHPFRRLHDTNKKSEGRPTATGENSFTASAHHDNDRRKMRERETRKEQRVHKLSSDG